MAFSTSDSLRIYFRNGESILDVSFHRNQQVLDFLKKKVNYLVAQDSLFVFSVKLCGNASPTDSEACNLRLSEERAERVAGYLRQQVELPDSSLSVSYRGVDWQSLEHLVQHDSSCPQRKKVLDIVRRPAHLVNDWIGRPVDERKRLLLFLNGGQTYQWMKEHYFGRLQNVLIEIRVFRREEKTEIPVVTEGVVSEWNPVPEVHNVPEVPAWKEQPAAGLPKKEPEGPAHRLALKTNLLYDAILMPSLEIEYRLNARWSLNLEGNMAWWKNDSRHKYYQLAILSPEARYWFKTRKPWHGHYVGAFGGCSWYDLENGEKGYQGEALMAGLSYGYQFPIGRNLSLEAGLGVGYLLTRFKEYLPIDDCYVYQRTKKTSYVGPLKLKLALVWRLWKEKQKGGSR